MNELKRVSGIRLLLILTCSCWLVDLATVSSQEPAGDSRPAAPGDPIAKAAGSGDIDGVEKALARGDDINARSAMGLTALQSARIHGWKDVADFLLAKGADDKLPMPAPEQVIDAFITTRLKGSPAGIAVLAARDGRILWKKGYGFASLGHRISVTPETRFRIGSITKQFTAAAVLKLAEQGKLAVDDKLAKFFADYPRGGEVTVHHLLTHTSGIQSYTNKPDFLKTVRLFTGDQELIDSFKNDPFVFEPGKKWAYCNSGYFLLGKIVEKTSGSSYGDFLRKEFFEPQGMKSTGLHRWSDIIEDEADGYSYVDGKFQKAENWDMSRAGGAGALYSTIEDLYRWNEALFSGKVLSRKSLDAAFTPVRVEGDEKGGTEKGRAKLEGYGYGWGIGKLRGLKSISHGGGLQGFTTYLFRLPQHNFTAVVLSNCSPPPPEIDTGFIAHETAQLYLWEKMEVRKAPKTITVPSAALDAYTGRYDYGFGILTVEKEDDRLFAQLTGQPRYPIFPRAENVFFWKAVEAEVTFIKDNRGVVTKAVHRQGGQTINAPRLPDVAAVKIDPKIFEAYTGKYNYGDGKAILTVTREGDHLYAQLTGQPRFEIFPKSKTQFFWKAVDAQVTFLKNAKGKVVKALHEQGGVKFEAPKIE